MAFTPVWFDGAEHGVGGVSLDNTPSAGAGIIDTLSGSGTIANVASPVATGNGAYKIETSSNTVRGFKKWTASNLVEGCFKVRRAATPSVINNVFQLGKDPEDNAGGIFRINTSNQITAALYDGTIRGEQTGPTLALDTWTLIEFALDISTTSWVLQWRVAGVAQTNSTFTAAAARTVDLAQFGFWPTNATMTLFLDDMVIGTGSVAEHPIGDHFALGYLPNAVGTHNLEASPSNSFFKDISGTETALTSSETTSWDQVDGLDLVTSNDHVLVDPDASLAATHYLEYALADAAGAPLAVRGYAALAQDTALADTIVVRLREGGSNADIYSGAINGTGLVFPAAVFATKPSGGAWTKDTFNATTFRFGFSTDVDGRVRLHGAAVEALFKAGAAAEGSVGMFLLGVA